MSVKPIKGTNGDITYQVLIRRKGHRTVSKNFKKKALADKFERQTLTEMDNYGFVDMSKAEKMTFKEALEQYVEQVTPSKKGAKTEGYRSNAIKRHAKFVDMSLARIRPTDIRKYRIQRLATIN